MVPEEWLKLFQRRVESRPRMMLVDRAIGRHPLDHDLPSRVATGCLGWEVGFGVPEPCEGQGAKSSWGEQGERRTHQLGAANA